MVGIDRRPGLGTCTRRTCCASTRCSPTASAARWSARAVTSSWLCAPRWDSDAVFSALIGGRGVYAVTPVDARFVWGGFYEHGTPDLAHPAGSPRPG